MSINCFVVDDERHGIEGVVNLIEKLPELNLIGTETDPVAALNKILSGIIKVDILFLDIDMETLSGFEFSQHIGKRAVIIFVTGHTNFALQALKSGAADYLTKPIIASDFIRAINNAKEKLIARERLFGPSKEDGFIFLKLSPRNIIQVKLMDLIYISANDKYIDLHTGKTKPIMIKKSLLELEQVLPHEMFMRVHKSHIINVSYIDSLVGNKINMRGAPVLEIGSTYLNAVYSRFESI